MRVLFAPDRFGALTAVEAARVMIEGWTVTSPHLTPIALPQSTGGPGFLSAVEAARGGSLELLTWEGQRSAPVLFADQTAYVEAAQVLGQDTSSYALGRVLELLLDAGATRIAIGIGGLRALDGGHGLIEALGRTPEQARDRFGQLDITVAVDTDRVLLGLQGACASAVDELGLSKSQAQAAETRMGEWVDEVRRALPPPIDLLSGRAQRLDRLPGAGAGGGLGFALAALGATLRPGPQLLAEISGLKDAVRLAAVVVTATTTYDWRVLQHSVPEQVARAATACATPAVLLADDVQVGRRETMSLGIAGSYGVLPAGQMRVRGEQRTAQEQVSDLEGLARRVARTWTPHRI